MLSFSTRSDEENINSRLTRQILPHASNCRRLRAVLSLLPRSPCSQDRPPRSRDRTPANHRDRQNHFGNTGAVMDNSHGRESISQTELDQENSDTDLVQSFNRNACAVVQSSFHRCTLHSMFPAQTGRSSSSDGMIRPARSIQSYGSEERHLPLEVPPGGDAPRNRNAAARQPHPPRHCRLQEDHSPRSVLRQDASLSRPTACCGSQALHPDRGVEPRACSGRSISGTTACCDSQALHSDRAVEPRACPGRSTVTTAAQGARGVGPCMAEDDSLCPESSRRSEGSPGSSLRSSLLYCGPDSFCQRVAAGGVWSSDGNTPSPAAGGVWTSEGNTPSPAAGGVWTSEGNTSSPAAGGVWTSEGNTPSPAAGGVWTSEGNTSSPAAGGVWTSEGNTSSPAAGGVWTSEGNISPPAGGVWTSEGNISPPAGGVWTSEGNISPPAAGGVWTSEDNISPPAAGGVWTSEDNIPPPPADGLCTFPATVRPVHGPTDGSTVPRPLSATSLTQERRQACLERVTEGATGGRDGEELTGSTVVPPTPSQPAAPPHPPPPPSVINMVDNPPSAGCLAESASSQFFLSDLLNPSIHSCAFETGFSELTFCSAANPSELSSLADSSSQSVTLQCCPVNPSIVSSSVDDASELPQCRAVNPADLSVSGCPSPPIPARLALQSPSTSAVSASPQQHHADHTGLSGCNNSVHFQDSAAACGRPSASSLVAVPPQPCVTYNPTSRAPCHTALCHVQPHFPGSLSHSPV